VGSSDTLELRTSLLGDPPLSMGHWEVVLPPGLALLTGDLRGSDLTLAKSGYFTASGCAYVRCERWGDFRISYGMQAAQDSTNWSTLEGAVLVHAKADSFATEVSWPDFLRRFVVDGVHYREHSFKLIPLDPGEDERVSTEVGPNGTLQPAPAIHRESAIRASSAAGDSTVEVPVWVAVDRAGRVKAVEPTTGPAAEAAWKWTFTPVQSLGRPVSMLYLIRVPVSSTGKQ
jgi:hypothetical protein